MQIAFPFASARSCCMFAQRRVILTLAAAAFLLNGTAANAQSKAVPAASATLKIDSGKIVSPVSPHALRHDDRGDQSCL